MDPITALSIAASAVSNAKSLMSAGRDATGALVKFAGAVSDINYAAERAKNPSVWKSLTGSPESEAMEVFAAQKKIAAMRQELETLIQYSYGQSGLEQYKETLRRVKADRQKSEYRRAELKEALIVWGVGLLAVSSAVAMAGFVFYFIGKSQGKW
jgi:hypothetical protein